MASSSSAKKVARVAARSGTKGTSPTGPSNRTNWLFGAGIAAIVLLGIGAVVYAMNENQGLGANTQSPKANLGDGKPFDHWHAAFGIDVCGKEIQPLQDGSTDPLGIHTHGDGLIHIHPFTRTASGSRATMGKYFDQVSFTVTDAGFRLPKGTTTEAGGTTVKEGETTCGGKPGEVVMAFWKDAKNAPGTKPDKIYRSDFRGIRFTNDLSAYTLAFVPKGSTDIPAPSSSAEIEQLGAADAGGSGSTPASGAGNPVTETAPATAPSSDTTPTTAASGG